MNLKRDVELREHDKRKEYNTRAGVRVCVWTQVGISEEKKDEEIDQLSRACW